LGQDWIFKWGASVALSSPYVRPSVNLAKGIQQDCFIISRAHLTVVIYLREALCFVCGALAVAEGAINFER